MKVPRSSMNTPIISNQETLFENMEEFSKCNHRLKLYFDINVFAKLDEEFLCQIRVRVSKTYHFVRFNVTGVYSIVFMATISSEESNDVLIIALFSILVTSR